MIYQLNHFLDMGLRKKDIKASDAKMSIKIK